MDSRQSIRHLTESIYSLLGSTSHLTSNWADSVCEIVKNLSPKVQHASSKKIEITEIEDCVDANHVDFDASIIKIKDEVGTLSACINQLNEQWRELLEELLDLKGNIRVYCRVRPMTLIENFSQVRLVEALDSSSLLLKFGESKSKLYNFDKVFHPTSSQDEIFSEIEPVFKAVLDGYNACIFAYGQTGAGKTFTMAGSPDTPGIVPRVIMSLFKQADDSNQSFVFGFSMLEIYLGDLKDLLGPLSRDAQFMPPRLAIQTDKKGGTEIENLVTIQVRDYEHALRLYNLGCQCRSTASTNSNINSSRSHCMIRISMTCFDAPKRKRETTKIWMVDLGGSERLTKTKAWGRRLEEGKAINLSLSALGDVMSALQRKKRHIPYRNSKLTRVLKDSLGKDSKVLMLVHISPKEEDLCETVCSLNFAMRVRSIQLANEASAEARYQKEVAMNNLQQKMKKVEDERENVKRKIEKLNKRLENLTSPAPSSTELRLPFNLPQSSINGTEGGKGASLSQLPRFMTPTVCSRKKFRLDRRTPKIRASTPAKWRRASSRCAESENAHLKVLSECNSECSISKISCSMKRSADYETDYSRETSEYDIKTDIFPVQEIAQRSSSQQRAQLIDAGRNLNKPTRNANSKNFLKVDEWLHLHKNENGAGDHPHRSKGIKALFTAEKKNRRGQNKADTSRDEELKNHHLPKEELSCQDVIEKLIEVGAAETSMSEKGTERLQVSLKDLFNEDSGSNSSYQFQTVDSGILVQKEGSAKGLLNEDNKCNIVSSHSEYCGECDDQDCCGENKMSSVEVVTDEGDSLSINEDEDSGSNSSYQCQTVDSSILVQKEGLAKGLLNEDNKCNIFSLHHECRGECNDQDCCGENKLSSVEVVADEDDSLSINEDEDSGSNASYQFRAVDSSILVQKEGLAKGLLDEDNKCNIFSSHHEYRGECNDQDCYRENKLSRVEVVADEGDSLSINEDGGYLSSSNTENSINIIEIFDPNRSVSEEESGNPLASIQLARKTDESDGLHTSEDLELQQEMEPSLYQRSSERALVIDQAKQEDFTMLLQKSEAIRQDSGKGNLLQHAKSLWASISLGLGFRDLGLDHDFFHGLTL